MIDDNILLSIIVPCYNSENFILQGLRSILQQPLRELELIIIDDGSNDNTLSICKDYSAIDPRVKVFHIENHGVGYARNFGVDHALGKWLMFMDHDDLYLENSLNEVLVEKLKVYENEDIDVIFTSKCETDMMLQKPVQYQTIINNHFDHIPELEFWIGIYKRQYLLENNIRFFEYRELDVESGFRYRTVSKTEKIAIDPSICFYLRRVYESSVSNTWNLFTLHYVKARVYCELLEECNLKDREWIVGIIQKEIFRFYKCCLRAKCNNSSQIDWINKELRLIEKKSNKNIFGGDTKIRYANRLYYVMANIAQKSMRFNDIDCNKKAPLLLEDELIMSRLKVISRYIQECVISD